MNKTHHGKILIGLGVMHCLLSVTPLAFGDQFSGFLDSFLFKISDGLSEFPLLDGHMNYANFAAFWFFYFGLLLIPLGLLLKQVEEVNEQIPRQFIWSYLIVVLIGVYMIPFSGMTFLMLPHALFMFYQSRRISI